LAKVFRPAELPAANSFLSTSCTRSIVPAFSRCNSISFYRSQSPHNVCCMRNGKKCKKDAMPSANISLPLFPLQPDSHASAGFRPFRLHSSCSIHELPPSRAFPIQSAPALPYDFSSRRPRNLPNRRVQRLHSFPRRLMAKPMNRRARLRFLVQQPAQTTSVLVA